MPNFLIMKKQILLLIFLCFALACGEDQKTATSLEESEVGLCSIIDSPESYKSRVIQTTGIVLGFHTFILYNSQCLQQDKVLALGMNYESRQKLAEALNPKRINYKTSFINNNLYAELTVLGYLMENDENESGVFHPKYKFFVNEVKNVNILSVEIYPSEKARREGILSK